MFGRGIPLFRLFGIQVKLDPSWFIVAVLVLFTLSWGLFPQLVPGLSAGTYWVMGVVGALGLFASILAHEFGHALVARRRGLPMRGITLFIFGGVAEMTREPDSAKDEFFVAIAGPIVSVVIAAASFALMYLPLPEPVAGILAVLALVNTLLVAFNMIPAFPLDGGRVLRSVLWAWKKDLRWATRWASQIGGGFGLLLMAWAIVRAFLFEDWLGGMWLFLIALFLRSAARQAYEQVVVREALTGHPVRDFMNDRPFTVPLRTSVADFVEDHVYRYHRKMFPVVENGDLRGCVTIDRVRDLPRDEWDRRVVEEILEPCDDGNTINVNADAAHALQRMASQQRSRLMVTDGPHLVGVIALRDLIRHMELRRELETESPL